MRATSRAQPARSGVGWGRVSTSRGSFAADYDDDGDIDVAVSSSGGPALLLRNDGGNDGNFLMIRARGTLNREGIGARVRAVAGDLVQTREIRRGYGYMGSNDVRLHLGLGSRTRVDSLQIRWPSGIERSFEHVLVNRELTATEPK